MDPGAVFISYASEDRPAAEALRTALDAGGNGCLVRSRSPVRGRRVRVAHPAQHRALLPVHRRPVEVVRHPRSPLLPPRVGSGAARRGHRPRVRGVHPAGGRRRSAATITSSSPRSSASCTGRRSGQHGGSRIRRSRQAALSRAPEPHGGADCEGESTWVGRPSDTPTVDAASPWPGLAAFREADQAFFKGREARHRGGGPHRDPRPGDGAVRRLGPRQDVAAARRHLSRVAAERHPADLRPAAARR